MCPEDFVQFVFLGRIVEGKKGEVGREGGDILTFPCIISRMVRVIFWLSTVGDKSRVAIL